MDRIAMQALLYAGVKSDTIVKAARLEALSRAEDRINRNMVQAQNEMQMFQASIRELAGDNAVQNERFRA